MCGVAGFHGLPLERREPECRRMLEAMSYRGPDGLRVERVGDFTLGHLRLAVIDLSDAGRQPMRSADGRFVISFNGEIYNYRELREELERDGSPSWRGSSDTEVLLECIARWGVVRALQRCNGMFAFAVVDSRDGSICLARDRFGEKPLVYNATRRELVFASEMKAIEACGAVPLSVSREAIARQYRAYCIGAPDTVYRECRKLPPASYLCWRPDEDPVVRQYWSPADCALEARTRPFAEEGEALDALESALSSAVRSRMVSDVPLGAFLSGGVDSSTVVALAQASSTSPVKTFSIGFEVSGYNEAHHARAIARHLGTDHHEQTVTAADALAVVPTLGAMFDEPFSDSSQVPTWLVCRMARRHVTVSLSGDGGDELFAGYSRYAAVLSIWRAFGRTPLRGAIVSLLRRMPASGLDRLFFFLRPLADRYSQSGGRVGPKLHRLAEMLSSASIDELYLRFVGRLRDTPHPVTGVDGWDRPTRVAPEALDDLEMMMFDDTVRYLPDDILVKIDRTAMSVSLEGRVPMLDPQVFETAWRMPLSMKWRGGVGKRALKQVLYRHVPRDLVERPKMGFGAPIGEWLRGPLREWSGDLLSPARLRRQGLYDAETIDRMLADHIEGRVERADTLWSVLMVQAWLEADARRERRL